MDRTLRRPGSPYPNQMEFTGYKASVPGAGDNIPMIQTAENLAVRYSLTREECDAFVLGSHQKAAEAWEKGGCRPGGACDGPTEEGGSKGGDHGY